MAKNCPTGQRKQKLKYKLKSHSDIAAIEYKTRSYIELSEHLKAIDEIFGKVMVLELELYELEMPIQDKLF